MAEIKAAGVTHLRKLIPVVRDVPERLVRATIVAWREEAEIVAKRGRPLGPNTLYARLRELPAVCALANSIPSDDENLSELKAAVGHSRREAEALLSRVCQDTRWQTARVPPIEAALKSSTWRQRMAILLREERAATTGSTT